MLEDDVGRIMLAVRLPFGLFERTRADHDL